MTYFLIISCVLCGWAMLRVMGSERAYLVKELERNLRREARRAPAAADPTAAADSPPAKAAPATKGKN
jgi:hypothetical protein